MNNTFKIVRKTFSDLSEKDIQLLNKNSNPTGALRAILKAVSLGRVAHPDKMYITMLMSDAPSETVIGWVFIDEAKEYDYFAQDDEVSLMVYVNPSFRKKGIAKQLISEEIDKLSEKKVVAYPSKNARAFFRKIAEENNLDINFRSPVFYYKG